MTAYRTTRGRTLDPTLSRSEARAVALVAAGRVHEIQHARVFLVDASSGPPHTVVIGPGDVYSSCDCAAGRMDRVCCHLTAARLLTERERTQAGAAA